MYITLANIESLSRNRDVALEVVEQGVQANKGNRNLPQLIWGKADLQIDLGVLGDPDAEEDSPEYYEGARGTIRRLHKLKLSLNREFPKPQIGYLEARIAFTEHRWAEATRHKLGADADRLDALMQSHGAQLAGGTRLFRLYEVGDAPAWQDRLARAHVWSRIFPYSDRWLRLGLPAPDRWAQLEAAL